jgi:hypothetical protein
MFSESCGAPEVFASNLSIAFNKALDRARAHGLTTWKADEDLALSIACSAIEIYQRGEKDPDRIAGAVLRRLRHGAS